MHHFLSHFWQHIRPSMPIVLCVSGGVDSMVLLDLVLKVHPKENIIIAHFDHSLRGEASDADRVFVQDVARHHHLTFEVKKVDIAAHAEKQKGSLEAVARHERYMFFEATRQKYSANYILTAHHADDQIETVLLNLIKWGKSQGLSGMLLISGHIFRPLLTETKADILTHAAHCGINYREDASNSDTSFDRNKIRHQVVPALRELNPSLHKTIAHLTDYMHQITDFFDATSEEWLSMQEQKIWKKRIFSVQDFWLLHTFLQTEVIAELYRRAHGGSSHGLSTRLITEMIRYTRDAEGGTLKEVWSLLLSKKSGIVSYVFQKKS